MTFLDHDGRPYTTGGTGSHGELRGAMLAEITTVDAWGGSQLNSQADFARSSSYGELAFNGPRRRRRPRSADSTRSIRTRPVWDDSIIPSPPDHRQRKLLRPASASASSFAAAPLRGGLALDSRTFQGHDSRAHSPKHPYHSRRASSKGSPAKRVDVARQRQLRRLQKVYGALDDPLPHRSALDEWATRSLAESMPARMPVEAWGGDRATMSLGKRHATGMLTNGDAAAAAPRPARAGGGARRPRTANAGSSSLSVLVDAPSPADAMPRLASTAGLPDRARTADGVRSQPSFLQVYYRSMAEV